MAGNNNFFRNHIQAPCFHCGVRYGECHSTCPLYAEYKKLVDAARDQRNKEGQNIGVMNAIEKDRTKRFKNHSLRTRRSK